MADLLDSILDRPVSKVSAITLPPKPKTTAVTGVAFKRVEAPRPNHKKSGKRLLSSKSSKQLSSTSRSTGLADTNGRNIKSGKPQLTEIEKQKRREAIALLRQANRSDVTLESVSDIVKELESTVSNSPPPPPSQQVKDQSTRQPQPSDRSAPPPHARQPQHDTRRHPSANNPRNPRAPQPRSTSSSTGPPLPIVAVPDIIPPKSNRAAKSKGGRPGGINGTGGCGGRKIPREEKPKPVVIAGVVQPPRAAPPRPLQPLTQSQCPAVASPALQRTHTAVGHRPVQHQQQYQQPHQEPCQQRQAYRGYVQTAPPHLTTRVVSGMTGMEQGIDSQFAAERRQYDILMQRRRAAQQAYDSYYDEDEEDDLADFIDDGPLDNGANWRTQLRSLTGYDPRAFRGMDEGEAMESSTTQQNAEERQAARIAAREDAEELKRIQEEEAREAAARDRKRRRL